MQPSFAQVDGNAGNVYGRSNQGNAIYGHGYQQAQPMAYFISDTTIQLGVKVMMNVAVKRYVAILAVTQNGATADSCHWLISQRINSMIQQITNAGVLASDINIDFISQVPTFEYEIEKKQFSKRTYNEIPTGFQLKKNLHIGYARSEQLEAILAAAAEQEIYDLVKVEYIIENQEELLDSLRDMGSDILKKKLDMLTKIGAKIEDALPTLTESSSVIYPIERYRSYTAYSAAQLPAYSGRKNPIAVEVNPVTKPITNYYEKLTTSSFDAVLNPNVVEPSPQLTYELYVRYTFQNPGRSRAVLKP